MKRMYFDSDDNGDVGDCFERLAGRRGNETCPNILTYKEICSARNDTMCNETGDSPTILQYFQDETENCANIDFLHACEIVVCVPLLMVVVVATKQKTVIIMAVVWLANANVIRDRGDRDVARTCAPRTTRGRFYGIQKWMTQEADMVPWANILQFFQSDDRQGPVYTQTSSTQRQQMKQMEPSLDIYREAKLHVQSSTADTLLQICDKRAAGVRRMACVLIKKKQ